MYKFKLKENSEFEVGDVKVKDGTQSTLTDIDPTTGTVTWDLEKVGAFDTVYKTFDELKQLLRTLESEGKAKSDPVIDSISDNVKKLFNQYRTHIRKNYPKSWEKVKLVREDNSMGGKNLPNGDTYLGRDDKGNHKIESNGKVTLYNNEDMVLIYGKGWGHELNESPDTLYNYQNAVRARLQDKFGEEKGDVIFKRIESNKDIWDRLEQAWEKKLPAEKFTSVFESDIDEGEGIGYMTPNAFGKNKKSKNNYYYKLGYKPAPNETKNSGLEVKQLWETESLNEYSDFQQKRINMFDDVEEKVNSLSPLLSNAKNETAQYYNENPGSYTIVYSTDMVNELLSDITKLLKQGE